MIRNISELNRIIQCDKSKYSCLSSLKKTIYAFLCHDRDIYTFRYIKLLRKTEYWDYKRKQNKVFWPFYIIVKSRKNRLGLNIGIDMGENAFEEGLYIAHTGIIVGSAKIGKNCKLHGQNCIGSNVEIGDNCELWVGAKIIGPCKLADGTIVAAGALVKESVQVPGMTLAGVPAKIVSRHE